MANRVVAMFSASLCVFDFRGLNLVKYPYVPTLAEGLINTSDSVGYINGAAQAVMIRDKKVYRISYKAFLQIFNEGKILGNVDIYMHQKGVIYEIEYDGDKFPDSTLDIDYDYKERDRTRLINSKTIKNPVQCEFYIGGGAFVESEESGWIKIYDFQHCDDIPKRRLESIGDDTKGFIDAYGYVIMIKGGKVGRIPTEIYYKLVDMYGLPKYVVSTHDIYMLTIDADVFTDVELCFDTSFYKKAMLDLNEQLHKLSERRARRHNSLAYKVYEPIDLAVSTARRKMRKFIKYHTHK